MTTNHQFNLTVTEKLNFQAVPVWLLQIAERLLQNGHSAYLVGGAVRDLLWGVPPQDWDLATDALPGRVEQLFEQTVPTGKDFGTITINSFEPVEVTTIREDLGYSDGRHPGAVRFGSEIATDLARRDFTINALAYDFAEKVLIDPFQGRRDVYNHYLKAVGDPKIRFAEDGLRMIRFFRFLATLDLQPDRATFRGINPNWIEPVSMERIGTEFSKLLLGRWVRRGLDGLSRSGLLLPILPELVRLIEFDNRGTSHRWDLWEHTQIAVETIQPRLHLRLTALLHDIAKPLTRIETENGVHFYGHDLQGAALSKNLLERLRYPKQIINTVSHLIRWHMFALEANPSDAAIRRLIAKVGQDQIADLLELRRADLVATGRVNPQINNTWHHLVDRIKSFNQEDQVFDFSKLAVNGNDLLNKLKITPGPLIGEILTYLLEQVLDNPSLNSKPQLLDLAKSYLENR